MLRKLRAFTKNQFDQFFFFQTRLIQILFRLFVPITQPPRLTSPPSSRLKMFGWILNFKGADEKNLSKYRVLIKILQQIRWDLNVFQKNPYYFTPSSFDQPKNGVTKSLLTMWCYCSWNLKAWYNRCVPRAVNHFEPMLQNL